MLNNIEENSAHNEVMSELLINQMNILLVDDTPANIEVLSKTLEQEGYKYAIATDGYKAIKVASHLKPDLILLDVMMPGIDGFETCSRLKSLAETRDIPVIFITARTSTDDIINGFSKGGVDYISKPFHREEVLVRVKTQLQLRASIKLLQQKNNELRILNDQKAKYLVKLKLRQKDLEEEKTSLEKEKINLDGVKEKIKQNENSG